MSSSILHYIVLYSVECANRSMSVLLRYLLGQLNSLRSLTNAVIMSCLKDIIVQTDPV